jgi:hypothetical protein
MLIPFQDIFLNFKKNALAIIVVQNCLYQEARLDKNDFAIKENWYSTNF